MATPAMRAAGRARRAVIDHNGFVDDLFNHHIVAGTIA